MKQFLCVFLNDALPLCCSCCFRCWCLALCLFVCFASKCVKWAHAPSHLPSTLLLNSVCDDDVDDDAVSEILRLSSVLSSILWCVWWLHIYLWFSDWFVVDTSFCIGCIGQSLRRMYVISLSPFWCVDLWVVSSFVWLLCNTLYSSLVSYFVSFHSPYPWFDFHLCVSVVVCICDSLSLATCDQLIFEHNGITSILQCLATTTTATTNANTTVSNDNNIRSSPKSSFLSTNTCATTGRTNITKQCIKCEWMTWMSE